MTQKTCSTPNERIEILSPIDVFPFDWEEEMKDWENKTGGRE